MSHVSIANSRSDFDQGGSLFADALYRLTGFGYFSLEARARRARYQRALSELSQMSDRELSELGFRRCDVARVARETADSR
ncbi:MAG: DUF1127 domain-containing protein [Kiloniellaceae bacterium]